ncbi:MAG: hypothetical protein VB126_00335 [Paludibacter sp.]|nr:hypothetical protein [Paludibacter sp.]
MEFNLVTFLIAIIGGLTIGIMEQFYKAFVVPSEWMFKNRYHIEGMIITIPIVFIALFVIDYEYSLAKFAANLIAGIPFGYFLMGYVLKRKFIKLTGKIILTKPDTDSIILTDLANHKEKGINVLGQLFINNQKLIFIPIDSEKSIVEIDLHNIIQSMIVKNRFGIPSGLIVNEHFQFSLSYPKLWLQKINAA